MTPHDFIRKWRNLELKERTASQSHFNDLCALLGILDPISADPAGEWFTFEKGATKTGGGEGWADVWRRGHFAWEYKGKHANLDKAYQQLQQYAVALENPPLLITSDMDRIHIHTNWTNTVQEMHDFTLDELIDGDTRERLKRAFTDPEFFKPSKTRQALTEETAREFAGLAQRLRERGHHAYDVAHFVNRLAFCMFAEDAKLLPDDMFTKMLDVSRHKPEEFADNAGALFRAMAFKGGKIGFDRIEWFNGGLFEDDRVLPLTGKDIDDLLEAAKRDWSAIDPSILGTLFERGLDPDKRSQLGAHYTDREKIMQIVDPVISRPLEAEWALAFGVAKLAVEAADAKAEAALNAARDRGELAEEVRALENTLKSGRQLVLFEGLAGQKRVRALDSVRAELRQASREVEAARREVKQVRDAFLDRLRTFRVLDPACGSGNFLYVALLVLKDLEHRVNIDAETLGVPRLAPSLGPENVLGIELNPYAAELARVSVWIGDIQWMRRNGFDAARNPILRPLDTIECRDAIVSFDEQQGWVEAVWPQTDVIVGNPPFLGGKSMKRTLGEEYTDLIRRVYTGRITPFSDLVCYWFEKSRAAIVAGEARRSGLVATKAIAKNVNLPVLVRLGADARIYNAWQNEPWVVNGAAVRVSVICFAKQSEPLETLCLNGQEVDTINPNLTSGIDTTQVRRLEENQTSVFIGVQQSGPLSVSQNQAAEWLLSPTNPNGKLNSEVISSYASTDDVVGRPTQDFLIDFPVGMSEVAASEFERPFEYLHQAKYDPHRDGKLIPFADYRISTPGQNSAWWEAHRSRPAMRTALSSVEAYLVTAETTEHRVFRFLPSAMVPDKSLYAFPRAGMIGFGILQSRFHEIWCTYFGNRIGAGNQRRYNASYVYLTFPFPKGLTPNIPAADYADDPRAQAIAAAAARLNDLRENWLNPADLVVRVAEVVPGYPDRILPKDEVAAKELKKRTLTNLYNARPAWLEHAHRALDEAVAVAYGWGDDFRAGTLTDDDILVRLFHLNQHRAAGAGAD